MLDDEMPATATHEDVQEDASEQASDTIEDVKEDVARRDDRILDALHEIHAEIRLQTEQHVRHLESHATTPDAPVQGAAEDVASETTEKPSGEDEGVALEISEPKDMPKEPAKNKRPRKFGKHR